MAIRNGYVKMETRHICAVFAIWCSHWIGMKLDQDLSITLASFLPALPPVDRLYAATAAITNITVMVTASKRATGLSLIHI